MRKLLFIVNLLLIFILGITLSSCSGRTARIDEAARNAVFQTSDISEENMRYSGDYTYITSEDGEYVAIISYTGNEKEVKIPSKIDGKPVIALIGSYKILERNGPKNFVFNNANTIESVVIPDSVLYLDSAFFACKNLNNITLPRNLLRVSSGFGSCEKLKNVELPDTLEEIGEYTFHGCSSLTEINIPASLKVIGKSAFYGCSSLERISFPASLRSIDSEAFSGCSSLKEVVFSTESLTLGMFTFSGCSSLEKAEIPSVAELPDGVFRGCTGLKTITFSEGLEYIGKGAFNRCTGLTEITLPDSLLFINEGAFSECTGLTTMHLSHNTALYDDVYVNSSVFGEDQEAPELLYYDEKIENDAAEISEPEYIIEDLEGYTLRIFDIGSVDDRYYSMFDDESFQKVIEIVSEKYNCSIVEVNSEDWYNELRSSTIRGESSFCDVAIIPADMVLECTKYGYITPWEGDLSADWWAQSVNQQYNIGGVQLAVSGDFNINNFASQICYVYNREKLDAKGGEKYIGGYSDRLVSQAWKYAWGRNGEFGDSYGSNYMYNGGICASTFDYYRTMLAGQGIDFYSIADDGTISLSYGNGSGFLNNIEGRTEDPNYIAFRKNISLYIRTRNKIIESLKRDLREEERKLSGMADFMACDESLFSDGTSTFKIVRLDEIPALMETGMDIGLAPLPGGVHTSLVDTPTLAIQPVCIRDTYKNYIILDALARYSRREMLPAFTKSIIGNKPKPETNAQEKTPYDDDSTYSYNRQMIKKIYENPYYELDFGETGKEFQYLYYKYMLMYDATDLDRWGNGKLSVDAFNEAVRYKLKEIEKMNDYLEYNLSWHHTDESVASETKEKWAEDFFNTIVNVGRDPFIIEHVLDITKISAAFNRNGDCSFYDAFYDAVVLNDILSAYGEFTGNNSTVYDRYFSYADFVKQSDLNEEEIANIRRLFYAGDVCRYPLSYVQEALDYLYGEGMFDAGKLSNAMSFYVTEDRQYLYSQFSYWWGGFVDKKYDYEYVFYKLMDTQYFDKFIEPQITDNGAIIEMTIVGTSSEEGDYGVRFDNAYDYVTNMYLTRMSVNSDTDNAKGLESIEYYSPIGIYASGRVKLFLKKDSNGVHIMGIKTELP